MERYYVLVVGPAGSGKTTLVKALGDWMESLGISYCRVNLDPAVEWIPYSPDVDVREFVDARKVAEEYKLGPNGALVASIDLLHNYVYEIRNAIARTDAKYVLVDTPGQLELFAYRIASMEVMKRILNPYTSVALFLIDSVFAQRPSSLISLLLLSQSVRLRHGLPQIDALSKADMLTPELAKLLDDLEESSDLLIELLRGESGAPARLAQRLVEIIAEDGLKILRVSSHDPDSLWNVFEEIQRTLGAEEELEELEER